MFLRISPLIVRSSSPAHATDKVPAGLFFPTFVEGEVARVWEHRACLRLIRVCVLLGVGSGSGSRASITCLRGGRGFGSIKLQGCLSSGLAGLGV